MVKVMLVRHGETDWNREEIFRGRIDVGLNHNGREQAKALADATRRLRIDAIYSSPLSRSLETARSAAEIHNLDVEIAHGFVDFHFGEWQELRHQEVKEKFPDLYLKWQKSPHLVRIPGGESLDEVRSRAMALVETVIARHRGVVALVSHRVVHKVLICALLGLDNSHFWDFRLETGALTVFRHDRGRFALARHNDTSHLESLPETSAADF